jgi:hypothetical protein
MRLLLVLVLAFSFSSARVGAPTPPTLTEKEEKKLANGDLVVRKKSDGEQSARITGIIEIETDPANLWDHLLDFNKLLDENDALKAMDCYGDETSGATRTISCSYELRVVGKEIIYHNIYVYRPTESYLTWDLDPDKENSLERNHGVYQVIDVSGDSPRSRFVYISQVDTGRNIPKWVEKMLTASGLKQFMKSIKKRAEAD